MLLSFFWNYQKQQVSCQKWDIFFNNHILAMLKNRKSAFRRCHKIYGNGFPLTFVISKQTFRLMHKPWYENKIRYHTLFKDVRAHCYCASLVRTLYMAWPVPRHVFQARAPSRNATKYRAGGLCGNLICEYLLDARWPPLFFRQITSFRIPDSVQYAKKQKKSLRGKF